MTGAELKRIRTALKLTQAEFAERLKISRNTVNRMEFGGQAITPSMALLVEYVAREAGLESAHRSGGRGAAASQKANRGKTRNPVRKGRQGERT
jgi:transcriptional regulator with XRE-family HTH domain